MMNSLMQSIGFAPLLPVWLLALLGVAGVLLCAWSLYNGARGALLRLAALASLLFWLAGPQHLRESWHSLPQTALMLVDQSPSMSIGQRAAIARQAADALAHMQVEGLNIRTVTVRQNGHDGTRLFEALDQAAADIPPDQLAGAMMVTDGQIADVPPNLPDRLHPRTATGEQTTLPLHVLLTAKGEETDRKLQILEAPPYAIAGQPAHLRVLAEDSGPGTHAGTPAELTLRVNGEEPVVIPVVTGTPQDISIPVARPGQMLISLSVSPLAGEVSQLNNQSITHIMGIRDRLRVLLISGTPNQGERVWRRLLKADPAVDLIHFTILRPPEKDDGTPLSDLALIAFPVKELFQDKINQFDLIILDGFENRSILPHSYLENIANFVRRGGGLLLTAGPEFVGPGSLQETPVGDVLPAHVPPETGMVARQFRPRLTAQGRQHPVTAALSGAPDANVPDSTTTVAGAWGPWYRALKPDSTHGEVLMSGPDAAPLLVLDRVDQGRVALLLSDQIWLWSRGEGGGGPQAELLRRISHWLMKEPELEEEQLAASITDNVLTVTRHSISTEATPPDVTITAPSGTQTTLHLHAAPQDGSQIATLPANEAGIWQVTDGTHTAYAAPVQSDIREMTDLRATATKLAPIAQQSGGGVFWLGAPGHLAIPTLRMAESTHLHGADWLTFPQRGAHIVTGKSAEPLLPTWSMLLVSLALLFAGWWREGRN